MLAYLSYSSDFHSDLTSKDSFEEVERNKMPAEYAAYLLSTSPPGFDLHYTLEHHYGVKNINNINRVRATKFAPRRTNTKSFVHKSESLPDLKSSNVDDLDSLDHLRTRESHSDEEINTCQHNSGSKHSRSNRPLNYKNGKKRVSFADDNGEKLVHVRWMTESSDTPPRLRPEVLSRLTLGATACVTDAPALKLNFSQPASDYFAFREKIKTKCVSLENVILKDYKLLGTIKVKNLSFCKHVFLRATFNSWETSKDIDAIYVPNDMPGQVFDTFSFELDVPPNRDIRKKVQFCICFQTDQQEFWDNNEGNNYEVLSADWKSDTEEEVSFNTTDKTVYSSGSEIPWSQYSGWSNMDKSCPYY